MKLQSILAAWVSHEFCCLVLMKIIILKGLSLIMSSAAWCSSVHQRPRHLKTEKSCSLNLLVVKACRNSFQDCFSLGLKTLSILGFKKKKTPPRCKEDGKTGAKFRWCWPRVRTILHSFLSIFSPLVPIFHDLDITACLDCITWLTNSFGSFLARLVWSAKVTSKQSFKGYDWLICIM
jgi:hypothetical protein